MGLIAQRLIVVFQRHGIDPFEYGLVCYDKWPDMVIREDVVAEEAVYDDEGKQISPEKREVVEYIIPAGEKYSLRYEQCAALEAAYVRWMIKRISYKDNLEII